MSKTKVDISIVMPAYNVAGFISESIKSVLNQSLKDWELIIVDDNSTDNTVDTIAPFLNDRRIKLFINKKNLGGAGSRNVAINHARGRYIAFLDSDDLWSSDKLEKQVGFMRNQGVHFSFGSYTNIDEQGNILEKINVPKKVNFSSLLKHNYIGCLTAIYDTEPHGKIYMPLVKKRQDFALWLLLLKKFDYAYSVNDNIGFYRIRSGSLSRNKADALRYYWRVLRDIGGCDFITACYNLLCYIFIVFIKKNNVHIYNMFIKV